MSRGFLLPLLIAPLLAGCTQEELEDFFLDTYIVTLDAEPAQVVTIVNNITTAFELEPIHIFQQAAQGFQVRLPVGVVESIEGLDEVRYVVIDNPEGRVPDPGYETPDLGDGETPEGVARIGGPALLDYAGLEVAVIDTGVDLDHPELQVVGTADLVGEGGGTDSGGDDLHGHGTHVAGTIAALADGDSSGVAGVAPGVGVHAVRVLDENGSGTLGDIIAGLEYVLDHPEIRVANLSLGGAGDPDASNAPLRDALQAVEDAGVVLCIAAGNESTDTSGVIPAGYDVGVVVSAYDAYGGDNGFAYFSNHGDAVDITAPGVTITSTVPGGGYGALSGTSMATPHVSGAAAAWFAENPNGTPAQFRSALLNGAEDGLTGQGGDHPEGMVDLAELLD